MKTLYYGDNLKILRDYIKDESVDLIYLDPPFNSNRNYNVLFKDESGRHSHNALDVPGNVSSSTPAAPSASTRP